jgi:hypothetical protein
MSAQVANEAHRSDSTELLCPDHTLQSRNMQYDREHGPLFRQPHNPRARHLTIPEGIGPHVKLVFAEMRRQGRSYDAVEVASGVLRSTMKAWRKKNVPSLTSIEAVLNALGWRFTPTPVLETLPADVANDLTVLAERMNAEIPEVWAALIEISIQQRQAQERRLH